MTNLKPEHIEIASPSTLLSLYVAVLKELQRRQLVRSVNNPAADIAEFLAAKALGLQRAPKSTRGYDATDVRGNRYEIKGRRLTARKKSRQLSVMRGLRQRHFDYLVGVLFEEDFSVSRACLVPVDVVKKISKYRKHVNGWILHLRDSLWEQEGVRDITPKIQATEATLLRGPPAGKKVDA